MPKSDTAAILEVLGAAARLVKPYLESKLEEPPSTPAPSADRPHGRNGNRRALGLAFVAGLAGGATPYTVHHVSGDDWIKSRLERLETLFAVMARKVDPDLVP